MEHESAMDLDAASGRMVLPLSSAPRFWFDGKG